MNIQEKQATWNKERPLFEADFIHSHLLPFFNFNENTGDYEIKSEFAEDEDHKVAFETLNTGWVMWLHAKRGAKAEINELKAKLEVAQVKDGFVLVPKDVINVLKELTQLSSYAEIVGGISVNRSVIREQCDIAFNLIRELEDAEFAESIEAAQGEEK